MVTAGEHSKHTRRIFMSDDTVTFPAEFRVHWPGQMVYVCEHHKDALLHLNGTMGGGDLSIDSFDTSGESCSNCINEAKKS